MNTIVINLWPTFVAMPNMSIMLTASSYYLGVIVKNTFLFGPHNLSKKGHFNHNGSYRKLAAGCSGNWMHVAQDNFAQN